MPKLARVQRIVLPLLRAAPAIANRTPPVKCGSWVEDPDHRTWPILNVRHLGGWRHRRRPTQLAFPVIELTAYTDEGLVQTEDLYEDALEALYEAVAKQTLTEYGYLHSIKETMGSTEFQSPYQDTWRIQGLIQLGIRPPRT